MTSNRFALSWLVPVVTAPVALAVLAIVGVTAGTANSIVTTRTAAFFAVAPFMAISVPLALVVTVCLGLPISSFWRKRRKVALLPFALLGCVLGTLPFVGYALFTKVSGVGWAGLLNPLAGGVDRAVFLWWPLLGMWCGLWCSVAYWLVEFKK